jgi:hypothetical protein
VLKESEPVSSENAEGLGDEIEAMKSIAHQLNSLDAAARERVLNWAASRFDIAQALPASRIKPAVSEADRAASASGNSSVANDSPPSFGHAAELFDATRPSTDADRALVLAYWFQACQGNASFTSRQVNDELKHMGHGVGNITRALDSLTGSKPAMVIQLEKSGKTQQAQKKFKVTHEGLKRVQHMLAGSENQ